MEAESKNCCNCNHLREQLAEKDQEIQSLRARLEALVRHDPLTGVLNRRGLIEMLEAELQRAHRTGHPFCFAMIDLDHFKQLNDKYGHEAGDVVLKAVADTATNLLRTTDRFGRLGGEEFGIVLPTTWLDQGMIAMSRLTKAISGYDWERIAPDLSLTFSAGMTTNAPGDTADLITKRVEKALYQARQEGGNRLVQAEEALPEMPRMDLI